MKRTIVSVAVSAVLATATPAFTANLVGTESVTKEFEIAADATVVIDNPVGNIEVVGTDGRMLTVTARKTIRGVDQAALAEGRELTRIEIGGDPRLPLIRTLLPLVRTLRWSPVVNYSIRVPRTARVKIRSNSAERIRVANLSGAVAITNVSGMIVLEGLTGTAFAQTSNGNIHYAAGARPVADVQLSSVNGYIELAVAPSAGFKWIAHTIRGSFLTNLPVIGGKFSGTTYTGFVNSSRRPTITTAAMMGNVFVLRKGSGRGDAKLVQAQMLAPTPRAQVAPAAGPALSRTVRIPQFDGNYSFRTNIGDISIGQVQGNVRIETGAGEVQLGIVTGTCTVTSHGGPLDLGEISGVVTAETKAGDILVRSARSGGSLTTGGGIIRIFYAGGPMVLRSGGGDIFVRQASSSIVAETRSGDVTVNFEPGVKTASVSAKTSEGNVVLNVSPQFAADIDATVITSDATADAIRSDFGLTIQREQVGGRTRIRATGKINGGGEKVEIFAEEGTIRITAQSFTPVLGPIR